MDAWLAEAPLPLACGLLFVALLFVREAGSALARRFGGAAEGDEAEHGYVLSGVMGLLALLVAFTFGMALDRHDTRRDFVVAEANAIGTADMRVRLLDPDAAARLTALYRTYADLRVRYGHALEADKVALRAQSEALRQRIQAEALAALQPIRTTPLAATVTQAVNDSLDVGVAREAALAARLPASVLWALVVYALVAAGVMGWALAGGRGPHRVPTSLLFLLLTLSLGVILDLDQPQGGAIRVSQAPMERLAAGLAATPPPGAASAPPSPATPASEGVSGSSRPSAR